MSARENRIRREEAHKNKILSLIEEREALKDKVARKDVEIAKAIEAAQQSSIGTERIGVWLDMSRAAVYMFISRTLGTKTSRRNPDAGSSNGQAKEQRTKVKPRAKAKPQVKIRTRKEV